MRTWADVEAADNREAAETARARRRRSESERLAWADRA
jgi:hypothetical protein